VPAASHAAGDLGAAVCNIIETPGRTRDELERIEAHMPTTRPIPPEGCRLVLIGLERVITVWDRRRSRGENVDLVAA
jgi:hypothetical protein